MAAGRFTLGDAIEHRCQTIDISDAGVALRASMRARVGEHVICYLDAFGRFEGRVARQLEDGFAVAFTASPTRRVRLAQQIAAHTSRPDPSAADAASRGSIEPCARRVVLRLADGRLVATQIISLSRTGAALTCPVQLTVGTVVHLGRRPAQVARATQRLLAVAFATAIPDAEFTPDIVL